MSKENPAYRKLSRYYERKYGITYYGYLEILEAQDFCCAVCHRAADQFKTRLSVDHNHKTGELRGLLCTNCNRYVIGRHTSAELLASAAEYLKKGLGLFVPKKKRPSATRRRRRNSV